MSTAEQRNSLNEGRDSRAAAIAGSQYGLLSAAQAVAIGFTPNAIRIRVTRGRWDRMLPGVYRIAGAPTRGRQAALAAALWAGEDSRVSHLTAAVLWNLDGVVTRRVEITVPYECTRRHPAVVVHRTKTLPAVDRDVVHGIPVTTVARTLVDLAGSVDATVLETALDDALRKQLTTCAFVEWRVRELGRTGRAGVAVLRRLSRSAAEAPRRSSPHWRGRSGACFFGVVFRGPSGSTPSRSTDDRSGSTSPGRTPSLPSKPTATRSTPVGGRSSTTAPARRVSSPRDGASSG